MTGRSNQPEYSWTGHPLVDMGIAALVAFGHREKPADITSSDLEKFASYAEKAYFSPELVSSLAVLFTSNFIPINPNPKIAHETRKNELAKILWSFKAQSDSTLAACVYCANPSVQLVHRDLVPMLAARQDINFFPDGGHGLPLCGFCIVAIQALTVGALVCNEAGRPAGALVISCDDPQILLGFVREWQREIRKRVQTSQVAGVKQSRINWPRTRIVETIARLEIERDRDHLPTVTAYHLRNDLRGPRATIVLLPSPTIGFVLQARAAKRREAWKRIVNDAWEIPAQPKAGEEAPEVEQTSLRNYLFEDLFDLPEAANRFVRVYFLRKAIRSSQKGRDPRSSYCGWKDYISGLWDLTGLFLREVIAMDPARIEAIRNLGDMIAEEIATEDDSKFWWRVYKADSYRGVRLALIQASQRRLKRGLAPILSLDEFLEVFEEGEELARIDWRLAWDLVLIRTIEKLYEANWFKQHGETLESSEQEEQVEVKEA